MDVCKDELSNHPGFIPAAGPECGQELSLPDLCLSQSDGNILLQLLEFKAHLLEVVEELHIRRDAEERFEEQISKLVLEKQELEWDKESLQHQIESEKNLYSESLSKANKQFQGKIRNVEEEKHRYQVSAEQKDKDIHNLKEELKSLQLTKYNLEKKSSELEQKLSLQSRSKDSRLNQLSDVEKRFSALTRQCSIVKQAHEKLEQNVDEAMKLNKKLTSSNEKQEVTIASLNKEVEELRNKLVKTKMTSVNLDKRTENPSINDQRLNQLHQKLKTECEMNRKCKDENKALRGEKLEVLTSLQLAHQLLSKQTQTLSQLELNIETQRKQYQSLEQDHKAMQVKEKTVEEKIKQLMEEYTVSKSSWDKEKIEFLDQMKREQQELMTVQEAYEELHQNHMELSSKAKEQAQLINELKIKLKELDFTLIPSNSTEEGGNSGKGAFCESLSKIDLSNGVHDLTLAKGQAACYEEYKSEIIFESKINPPNNLDNDPSVTSLIENTTEHTNRCTMNEVSADAVVSSVFKSSEAQINSSATSSHELKFANTSVKLNTGRVVQGDNGAINKDDIVAMEEEDGHVKKNCEEPKEKGAEDIENSTIEEQAQTMNGASEHSVMVEDAKDAILNSTAEKVDKEHAGYEKCSAEEERQPQTTDEENQLYVTEVTRNNTQVSASKKPTITLQCTVNEKVDHVLPFQEIRQEVLPGDLMESQGCESRDVVQNTSALVESPPCSLCHDLEENTEMVSEESATAELPKTLNKSSSCQSQSDAAQLENVSVQKTIKMQTQMVSPPDTLGHTKDTVDKSAKECSPVTQIAGDTMNHVSQISEEKNNLTDSVTGTSKTSNNLSNDCEKKGEKEQVDILDKLYLKRKQSDGDKRNIGNVESQNEFGNTLKLSKITTKDTTHGPRESDFKTDSLKSQLSGASECQKNLVTKEAKIIDEFAVPIKTTYKPLFEWGSAQRRPQTYTDKSDMSAHSSLYTTSQFSQSNTCDYLGKNTLSIFHRSKGPLTITRATDLLNAFSVSGTAAASSRRHQQTEWRALREAHRDAAAQMDSRASVSDTSSLVSTSSATVSRPQTEIRNLSPDASRSPESEWGPSGSQDTEVQQSALRAQISKIEQFLSSERLRLPKRRKTEN